MILVLCLCSSCAATLKSRFHKQRLDVAYTNLDSLCRLVAIKDIHKEIIKLEDNSRIRLTKYSPPDSVGNQSIDYVVEIEAAVSQETTSELLKNEVQEEKITHHETTVDNSTIDTQEEYDQPPAVQGFRQIKGILGLIFGIALMMLIAYVIYKFKI